MSSKLDFEYKNLFEAKIIVGKTFKLIKLNSKSEEDANFVIGLRSRKLNNFLKESSSSVKDQMNYFDNYQLEFDKGTEIYYKIWDISKNTYNGIVRITELNEIEKFCYESMVVKEGISPVVPTDVVLSIYHIGFEKLGKGLCGPFPVSKNNVRVLQWHKKIGMTEIVDEDREYLYLEISSNNYFAAVGKYKELGLGFVSYTT